MRGEKMNFIKNILEKILKLNKKKEIEIDEAIKQKVRMILEQAEEKVTVEQKELLLSAGRNVTENTAGDEETMAKLHVLEQLWEDIQVDIGGAIRVCIKMFMKNEKPMRGDLINASDRHVIVNVEPSIYYGNFWSVSDSVTNAKFYGEPENMTSIARMVQQVQSGYSVIIIAIGGSGSGKTTTMFGDENDKVGLEELSLQTLINNNLLSLDIHDIQEDAMVSVNTEATTGHTKEISKRIVSKRIDHNIGRNINLFTKGVSNTDEVYKKLKNIESKVEDVRKAECRILPTMSNPASSRSHLFITLKASYSDGGIGYLTFADMAGRESPTDIFLDWKSKKPDNIPNVSTDGIHNIEISKCENVSLGKTSGQGPGSKIKNRLYPDFINFIMQQGIFINESLNLLQEYILRHENQDYKPPKKIDYKGGYNEGSVLTQHEHDMAIKGKQSDNTPNIISIIKEIMELSPSGKPAKILIVGTVVKNINACDVTIGTLAFLQKLIKPSDDAKKTQLGFKDGHGICEKIVTSNEAKRTK